MAVYHGIGPLPRFPALGTAGATFAPVESRLPIPYSERRMRLIGETE